MMGGTSIGNLKPRMGLCEGAGPQEAALLFFFGFACGFHVSLGCAIDLPSGLILGDIFVCYLGHFGVAP